MNKAEIIQKILDKKKASTYLEIGVARGENFFPMKVRQKIAVDPNFTFNKIDQIKWTIKKPCNALAKFHGITSDCYFANVRKYSSFDVVFIDGLHTYQQSLKDFCNSLENLKEDGVIVIHDCDPPHAAAAYPADSYEQAALSNSPGWTGEWCGDVWKTICYLRSTRKDLRVFVLDCDYGLGIITRGAPDNCLELSEQELDNMTYEEFLRDRKKLLNLKPENYLFEFLKDI